MLTTQQVNIVIDTLKPSNPTSIGIFGSFARGVNTPESDIDILYTFRNTAGLVYPCTIIKAIGRIAA